MSDDARTDAQTTGEEVYSSPEAELRAISRELYGHEMPVDCDCHHVILGAVRGLLTYQRDLESRLATQQKPRPDGLRGQPSGAINSEAPRTLCHVTYSEEHKRLECRWLSNGERWVRSVAPVETGWHRVSDANVRELALARRLAVVEVEKKARVERAWRQAWNAGRLSHAGNPELSSLELNDALDHDWQQSRARAELERAAK